jgi:hypothetical protein
MEEFAEFKKKQLEWKKFNAVQDKNTWQNDYLMLSKILTRVRDDKFM